MAPSTNVTSNAADVVASSERLTRRLRAFASTTMRKTPTSATRAMAGENNAATVPSSVVSANVRMPRSLLDHSRSIPMSRPIPSEVAIFAASSGGGNRVSTSIIR